MALSHPLPHPRASERAKKLVSDQEEAKMGIERVLCGLPGCQGKGKIDERPTENLLLLFSHAQAAF